MPNYIYALHCPIAETVRYIGKTNNPEARLISHIAAAKKGAKDHYTARWLRKLLRHDMRPTMEILETLDESENWEEYERFYIANGDYFGWKLTNTNPGGEGGGFVREEDKANWREKVKAGFTPEVRAHISATLKDVLNRPSTKAKHRANKIAQWKDPVYREEMLAKLAEANSRPEVMAKRRESSKAHWSKPESRESASEKLSAYYATPEGKANKSEVSNRPEKIEASRRAQKELWSSPEYRAAQLALKTTPEVLEKQRVGAVNQWADPEIRAHMTERITEARRARAEKDRRTPEQEAAWREERLVKRRQERAAKSKAFAESPEGIAHAAEVKRKRDERFANMTAASTARREAERQARIAEKNTPEAIAAREAKKLATRHAMYDRRNAANRAKKEAAGIKVRRSPYPPEIREEMNKARKKAQRAAKREAEKAAKLAESNS
ncbi:MAG: hypothetical protein [Caudoviricetes sp.]|nr:MAG: hypothetical protein [Caudoviricetes sp.]